MNSFTNDSTAIGLDFVLYNIGLTEVEFRGVPRVPYLAPMAVGGKFKLVLYFNNSLINKS